VAGREDASKREEGKEKGRERVRWREKESGSIRKQE
jgi:hypothetical protein